MRELALEVAALSELPRRKQTVSEWKRHNSLGAGRPMILVFPEGSWRELLPENLHQHCEDPWLRSFETDLRRRIYTARHFPSDNVIDEAIEVPKVIQSTGWGPEARWIYSDDPTGARRFDPIIHRPADLARLHHPVITHDEEASKANFEFMVSLVGDLIPVRLVGIKHVSFHLMSMWTAWRGLEETFMDMVEEPEFVHEAMEFLTRGHLGLVRQYEEQGLLEMNNDNTYHSTGGNAWSSEESLPDFDPTRIRPCDIWASAESQELDGVSPEMHAAFAMQYEGRLLDLFRHNGYGCCDGLHHKMSEVLALPKIRRVSMSPFADVDLAIPRLERRAIFSWKPHPGCLVGNFDENRIQLGLRHTLEVARDHGTVLEIILKDTHTCEHQPERFDRWTEICRREVDRIWD
jgi:hypothetical protein